MKLEWRTTGSTATRDETGSAKRVSSRSRCWCLEVPERRSMDLTMRPGALRESENLVATHTVNEQTAAMTSTRRQPRPSVPKLLENIMLQSADLIQLLTIYHTKGK